MKPTIAYLRPHETLSEYEMGYVELLGDRFNIRVVTTGNTAIGGLPKGAVRMRWPDEFLWRGRRKSFINAIYVRLMKRRYHIPGLACVLEDAAIVQALEATSEVSYQAARFKERFGYQLFLSCSENTPISADQPGVVRDRIRYTLSKTDHAFAITATARERLIEEGFDPRKVTVIGHGIDTERFSPSQNERRAGKIRVGYCGRFRREKGLLGLLEATANLDVETILLGDGPQKPELTERGKATFLPPRPYSEMHEFYRDIDIFVLPSIPIPGMAEQFGFVLIEAMASGVPVIATATGSIPEVVGDDAVLIPPRDISALRDAIAELISNPERRRDLAARGRNRVVTHFRREDIADRMAEIYRAHVRT